MSGPRWIDESIHHASVTQRLLAKRVLSEHRNGIQEVLVFENPIFGRTLMLDGAVQTTERDEFIYHEMLVHPALFAHGKPRRVLIVGGGDGGALKQTLMHRGIEEVTLVEIDPTVVRTSRKYLPNVSGGAFEDPRTKLVFSCGLSFVRETRDKFDVIIVDSTDPRGPSWALFTTDFYHHCRKRLAEHGILVAQSGVPFMQPDEVAVVTRRLRDVFKDVAVYMATVPTFYGGGIAFAWASNDHTRRILSLPELERRFAQAEIPTRYYAPDVHQAAFALPRFVREIINGHRDRT